MMDWLATTWNEAKQFLWSVVLSFVEILKDLALVLLDSVLILVLLILEGVGELLSGLNVTQYITAIPPHVGYIMTLCGFSEAMGMIIASLTIRMILQLIPFVRFGS